MSEPMAAVETEKNLLSALMLKDGEAISQIEGLLAADDFYRPEHKIIYGALERLYGRGAAINVLLVEDELRATDEIKQVTRQYLFSLANLEHTTGRVINYANIIREKAYKRRLIKVGHELSEAASTDSGEISTILEEAEKKILSVTTQNNKTGFEVLSIVAQKSFERLQHIMNHPNEMRGVPSGLIDLDRILNGFQKADLILLAARPSMGKTALAMNIAMNSSRKGNTVAVFSLEMSKIQLGNRLLSTASGINGQYLNTGNLGNEEIRELINALDDLSRLKLYIDDTAGIGLMELRSKIRRLQHEHGLDLIIIDYLQLMQGTRAENRQQEISEISRGLKALAREMNVPILALSQLSRSVEMRAEKKPQLSDLRESGSLEQDADIVMFLYRDEYYNRDDTGNENIAELIIAKNRNGPTTSIRLQFDKSIMRFGDLTRMEG